MASETTVPDQSTKDHLVGKKVNESTEDVKEESVSQAKENGGHEEEKVKMEASSSVQAVAVEPEEKTHGDKVDVPVMIERVEEVDKVSDLDVSIDDGPKEKENSDEKRDKSVVSETIAEIGEKQSEEPSMVSDIPKSSIEEEEKPKEQFELEGSFLQEPKHEAEKEPEVPGSNNEAVEKTAVHSKSSDDAESTPEPVVEEQSDVLVIPKPMLKEEEKPYDQSEASVAAEVSEVVEKAEEHSEISDVAMSAPVGSAAKENSNESVVPEPSPEVEEKTNEPLVASEAKEISEVAEKAEEHSEISDVVISAPVLGNVAEEQSNVSVVPEPVLEVEEKPPPTSAAEEISKVVEKAEEHSEISDIVVSAAGNVAEEQSNVSVVPEPVLEVEEKLPPTPAAEEISKVVEKAEEHSEISDIVVSAAGNVAEEQSNVSVVPEPMLEVEEKRPPTSAAEEISKVVEKAAEHSEISDIVVSAAGNVAEEQSNVSVVPEPVLEVDEKPNEQLVASLAKEISEVVEKAEEHSENSDVAVSTVGSIVEEKVTVVPEPVLEVEETSNEKSTVSVAEKLSEVAEKPVVEHSDISNVVSEVEAGHVTDEPLDVSFVSKSEVEVDKELNEQSAVDEVEKKSQTPDTNENVEAVISKDWKAKVEIEPSKEETSVVENANSVVEEEKKKEAGGVPLPEIIEKATGEPEKGVIVEDTKKEESNVEVVEESLKEDAEVALTEFTTTDQVKEINITSGTETAESLVKTEDKFEEEKVEKIQKIEEVVPMEMAKTEDVGASDSAALVAESSSEVDKIDTEVVVSEEKKEIAKDDNLSSLEASKDREVEVATNVVDKKGGELEGKLEEPTQSGEDEVEKTEDTTESSNKHDVQNSVESSNDVDSRADGDVTKQEAPMKQKQSNNIISKVKHSIGKVKKAIMGKSPSSKTLSSESKGDIK